MSKYKNMVINLVLFINMLIISETDAVANGKMEEVFVWKQMGYDFKGIKYTKDADTERKTHAIYFEQELEDSERFFIQYNNIPIGFEVYGNKVFVTVPRRRHGIPSTLNYMDRSSPSPLLKPYPNADCVKDLVSVYRPRVDSCHRLWMVDTGLLEVPDRSSPSPLLKPYPNTDSAKDLVSVYRPRVDSCHRLWMVDTGLLEVPDARRQVQPPSIVIYDLKTNKRILKHKLKPSIIVSNRTTGGLTSITVDVEPSACDKAYAYINDLATETMVVFSLADKYSWSISHPSFRHDEDALNFTVAGYVIPWRDGLFSLALSDADYHGRKKLFYHPLVSTMEFYVYTADLKNKITTDRAFMIEGSRGSNTQSGSHAYHSGTRTLLFANVAQDAILCWNIDMPLTPEHVAIIAQDREKLVYISDLKIVEDEVWVLVNQIPRFVFSTLNVNEDNFFIHKGSIPDMIRGTPCENYYNFHSRDIILDV